MHYQSIITIQSSKHFSLYVSKFLSLYLFKLKWVCQHYINILSILSIKIRQSTRSSLLFKHFKNLYMDNLISLTE